LNQVYSGARTVDGLSYLRQQADEGIGEIFPIATVILVGGDTGIVELRKPFDLTLNERTIAMVDELLEVGITNRCPPTVPVSSDGAVVGKLLR
jgi:hypothetical protein